MRTLGLMLTLALVAVVAWFLWQSSADAVPADNLAPATTETPAAAELSAAPTAPPTAAAPSEPVQRDEIATPAPTGPRLARFFGRCVDAASKTPLGGCKLQLSAWTGNTERMEKYGKKVEWTDLPDVVTGADGRFEFTFDPPPPYQFALDVTGDGRASLSGRWGEVAAGEQKDLGDLELPFGARVSGTIVDTKGQARARTQVHVEREDRAGRSEMETVGLRSYTGSISGPDGAFAFREGLGMGKWSLRIGAGARLKEPKTLSIEPGQAAVALQVVVFADDEVDVIEGVVLDEQDRPAAHLSLDHSARGQRWICSTDRAGKFRLVREEGDSKDPVSFSVNIEVGYEPMQDGRTFPWGTKDVVLRVRRAQALEVQALDADTGAPIEEYGVRCFRDPASSNGWSSSDFELRAQGRHEQGIAQVPGVRRGKNLLLVEPADRAAFAPTSPVAFEMTDGGAPRQVVRLPGFAERTVEVVRIGGGAVAGTKVELLLPVETRPITMETMALEPQQIFQRGNMPQAMLAHATTTDAEGRCRVRGARGATFVVRVLGPGHAPVVQPDVTLEGDALRIAVPAGATLIGKLTPASVLAQLMPPAAVLARAKGMGERGGGFLQSQSPGLQLVDPSGTRRFPAGHLERLSVAEDGSFRIEGISPGDWLVLLNYWTFEADGRGRSTASEQLARVDGLAEGETREVVLDAARLEHGELRGVVFSDDAPLADTRGQLIGMCPDGQGGARQYGGPVVTTGAEGRFTARLLPGTWKLWLMLPTAGEQFGRRMELAEAIEVRSGATADAVFRFVKKTLKVLLVDTSDRPCADRSIEVQAGQTWAHERTDAQGTLTLDPALPGLMKFFTWPADLATQEQRNLAMRTDRAIHTRRIILGEYAIPADKKHDQITLRLPQ